MLLAKDNTINNSEIIMVCEMITVDGGEYGDMIYNGTSEELLKAMRKKEIILLENPETKATLVVNSKHVISFILDIYKVTEPKPLYDSNVIPFPCMREPLPKYTYQN